MLNNGDTNNNSRRLLVRCRCLLVLAGIVIVSSIIKFPDLESMSVVWKEDEGAYDGNSSIAAASAADDHSDNDNNTTYDYDSIYNSFGSHSSYMDRRLFNFTSFDNYTSTEVLSNGCPLTVVIVDPRPPMSGYNHPIYYSLESLALYVPDACVVFHTASCQIIRQGKDFSEPTNRQKVHVVAKTIYERSLPGFRRMMEHGQVRINVIDVTKYGLQNCDNFGKGNNVFMSIHFWQDEFIDELDNDMVLTFQDDAVLCRSLNIDIWKQYAYVGAPWNTHWHIGRAVGGKGCNSMRNLWQAWVPKCNGLTEYQTRESFAHFCDPGFGGYQGNGGLSLRHRKWMIEVIQRCPSEHSGLEEFEEFNMNEDVYFSTILNGLNATMPSALEASLFSVENLFPEDTIDNSSSIEQREIMISSAMQRLWGNETGTMLYDRMHREESYPTLKRRRLHTIPLGFHKPWIERKNIFYNEQIRNECKMLKFIVPGQM
jgi:hypothetical protein